MRFAMWCDVLAVVMAKMFVTVVLATVSMIVMVNVLIRNVAA